MKKNILRISILVGILVFFIYNIIILATTPTPATGDMTIYEFGLQEYGELKAYTGPKDINDKVNFISHTYDTTSEKWIFNEFADIQRQQSSRNFCIQWVSLASDAPGWIDYKVTGVVDINLDNATGIKARVDPTTGNTTDGNTGSIADSSNAALAYIAYFGTELDPICTEKRNR